MRLEYEAILDRHEKDIDVWKQSWERRRADVELERAAELETNANLRKSLAIRISEPRMKKRSHVPIGGFVRGQSAILTDRTRQMIVDYRNQSDSVRLDVKPSSVRKMVKLDPRTPKKKIL
jgi:hypothetical protein